ncbi:hypothetical protein DFQ28_006925 [Apophysomyces sp. BC1034]|nr:hypothetical protein DFQ28_006925 [Apophysomyces sp. BC1034]
MPLLLAKRNSWKATLKIASNAPHNTLAKDAPRISGAIDGEKFMAARIPEIKTLHAAIKSTSHTLDISAFPSLLRGLRRRPASHNLYRPAARQREAASQKSVRLYGKQKSIRSWSQLRSKSLIEELFKRQRHKKWLETHMWHVKRMNMKNIWGYRLLTGQFKDIVRVLDAVSDPNLPSVGSARHSHGKRAGHTFLYEHLGYPAKYICPVTYLWKPNETEDETRMLWMWVHPSAYSEALYFVKQAVISEKSLAKQEVKVCDLREELVRFEITGPQSTAILQSILDPIDEADATKGKLSSSSQLWRDLKYLRSNRSLPPGVVIGLTVQDPRLKFPQSILPPADITQSDIETRIKQTLANWPEDVSYTAIWEDICRKRMYETKTSEQSLRKRREQNLLPGSKLLFTPEDNQIPLLLIQRGSVSYDRDNATQHPLSSSASVEGWTIILPRGWGKPFWKSLVFTGARIAGIDDFHTMHVQSGFDCFPYDVPSTRAFEDYRARIKNEAESAWLRKPSAKRLNYVKLGIDHPFETPFDILMQPETCQPVNDVWKARPGYSLLQGDKLISLLLASPTKEEAEKEIRLKIEVALSARHVKSPSSLCLNQTLLKVQIKCIDRGRLQSNAIIYLMEDQKDYERAALSIRQLAPGQKAKKENLQHNYDNGPMTQSSSPCKDVGVN